MSVIQRFIIICRSLVCHDESASIEELSDCILYYYHSEDSEIMLNAIQFMGYCFALEIFSKSFQPDKEQIEYVALKHSSLIFCPLEGESNDILAIAQIFYHSDLSLSYSPCAKFKHTSVQHPRNAKFGLFRSTKQWMRSETGSSNSARGRVSLSPSSGADPNIIREAFRKSHLLFILLKSGGILHRMYEEIFSEGKGKDFDFASLPPKIDNLKKLRKRLRKTNLELDDCRFKFQFDAKEGFTFEQEEKIRNIEEQVKKLKIEIDLEWDQSPFKFIRNDLKFWYDSFIENMCGRCLGEMLPLSPITGYISLLDLESTMTLHQLMEGFHAEFRQNLLAFSVFFESNLIYTEGECKVNLSREKICLLFEFLTLRKRIIDENGLSSSSGRSRNTFHRLSLQVLVRKLAGSSSHNKDIADDFDCEKVEQKVPIYSAMFYSPPNLASTGVDEYVEAISSSNLGDVWVPRLYIDSCLIVDEEKLSFKTEIKSPIRVAVFEYPRLGFIFMLFLREDEQEPKSPESNQDITETTDVSEIPVIGNECKQISLERNVYNLSCLLVNIFDFLSYSLDNAFDENRLSEMNNSCIFSPLPYIGEPGLDVIYIDYHEHFVQVVTSKEKATLKTSRKSDINYLLCSVFPHNVVVALEDILLEVQLSLEQQPPLFFNSFHEMCTFLPCHKWVFARWHSKRMLLMICDAHYFVTLSDVHRTVIRVKKEMLKNILL